MTNLARRPPLGQRQPPLVSTRMRRSAAGQTCTLRLPCCNGRMDTTVLAHLRAFGVAGMGQKPPDWCAVYACSTCHDALDRRNGATAGLWGYEDVLRALIETHRRMWAAGIIQEATP